MQKAAASAESAWALRAQRVTSRVDEVRRLKDQAGKSSRGRQSGLNTPRCRACTLQYDSQIHLSSEQPHPTFSGGPRSLSALEFSVCFISTWPCSRSPPLYKRVCDRGWVCALLSILLPASCVLEANLGSLVHARFAGFVTDVRRPNRSYCQRQHVLPRVAPKFWGR